MKKAAVILAGAMMILSLAACSPTEVAKESRPQAAQMNPDGVDPQKLAAERETMVDPKTMINQDEADMESVLVYYPNAEGNGLERDMMAFEEMTAEEILAALAEAGAVAEDVTVNSWEVGGGVKAGPGVDPSAVVDGDRIGILDVANLAADVDACAVYALGNTFCEAFELDKLEILVDGEAYEHDVIEDGYVYFLEKFTEIK